MSLVKGTVKGIIKVYQSVWSEADGTVRPTEQFYSTFHVAQLASTSIGRPAHPEVITRDAVVFEDGSIWVLEKMGPRPLWDKVEDAKKKAALMKLTKEERELLGLEEP